MALSIERRVDADVVILTLSGRVTIGPSTDQLNDALRSELSAGTRKLVVNLTAVSQVDSSGLATLVRNFVSMRREGGVMRMVIPPGRVREVFDVLQLTGEMSGLPDEGSALSSLR